MNSIPKLVVLRVAVIMIVCVFAVPRVHATCDDSGYKVVAGQIPDVTFVSGLPATTHVKPWWASFDKGAGCGLFARSTTPGVSVQDTYCSGSDCKVHPPGEWAAVASAYHTLFDRVTRDGTDIPLIFDGKTPIGSHGTLDIGIIDNDLGLQDGNHISIIYAVNIYIESSAPPSTWFTIISAPANIAGDQVLLDHPYLNGNPSALLFVSHVWNPNAAVSGRDWNHAIAVHYDAGTLKWTIKNVDGTAMPAGLGFNVRIDPTAFRTCSRRRPIGVIPRPADEQVEAAGANVFPQKPNVPAGRPAGQRVIKTLAINNVVSNNNHWATVFVTPIDGSAHPIAVRYSAPNWHILYYDGADISESTCFNVKVFAFTQYIGDPAAGDLSNRQSVAVDLGLGEDIGGSGFGKNIGSNRFLPFAWAQRDPNLPIIVTVNLNPLEFREVVPDPKYIGVFYDRIVPSVWGIFHEDRSDMHGMTFNVWAPR